MRWSRAFTKTLATVGTGLAWFPFAAMVVTGVVGSIMAQKFRLDYLMPAELFPVALAGGALVWWAALRARVRQRAAGWGFVAMLGLLLGSQALAVLTGLASGEVEASGWPWILVIVSIAGYTLALLAVAWLGTMLIRDLFRADNGGRGAIVPGA